MNETTEIQVVRRNLAETRVVRRPRPVPGDGDVLVEVEKFALTANNVSYAVSGDMIGYWKFYPAWDDAAGGDEPWGIVPVWGFARVVESRSADLPVGARMWGFLPMASHAILRPVGVTARGFVDDTPHRRDLPSLYNLYQRTDDDPPGIAAFEDERCVLVPLFTTSFVIKDWLDDNAYFGARQVLIGSASSKTGFGLSNLLARDPSRPVRVVGLTSPANRAFVEGLGTCDEVVVYDELRTLDASVPSAFVDMSGSTSVLRDVHEHFAGNLKVSSLVGVTHWQGRRRPGELPGPAPEFFFAPGQIAKRDQDWGPGEILRRALAESLRIARESAASLKIVHVRGADECRAAFDEMIAGRTPPSRGVMLSLV